VGLAKMKLQRVGGTGLKSETCAAHKSAISKNEKRTDIYLSTLRRYVEAMGGSLEIQAVFPEGAVRVDILSDK
jgi:hypothetical protein